MARHNRLDCDYCGKEIKGDPQMPVNDHVAIQSINSPTEPSNMTYAISWPRKLDRPYEFCDLGCASSWLNKRVGI
jgi:hypothetical protein